MKFIVSLVLILVVSSVHCQLPSHQFNSYFFKNKGLTQNRVARMPFKFTVTKTDENNYAMNVYFSPDKYIRAEMTFTEKFDFAGTMTYYYQGDGWYFDKPMKFEVEAYTDLEQFVNGKGVSMSDRSAFEEFEIKFYHWPANTEESLFKEHFYVYPIIE